MKNFIGVHKTEEEQEDQIKNWWKDNGIQIIGGIVIGIAGIWGWDYYQNHIYAQSIEARDLYLDFSVNNNSLHYKTYQKIFLTHLIKMKQDSY